MSPMVGWLLPLTICCCTVSNRDFAEDSGSQRHCSCSLIGYLICPLNRVNESQGLVVSIISLFWRAMRGKKTKDAHQTPPLSSPHQIMPNGTSFPTQSPITRPRPLMVLSLLFFPSSLLRPSPLPLLFFFPCLIVQCQTIFAGMRVSDDDKTKNAAWEEVAWTPVWEPRHKAEKDGKRTKKAKAKEMVFGAGEAQKHKSRWTWDTREQS